MLNRVYGLCLFFVFAALAAFSFAEETPSPDLIIFPVPEEIEYKPPPPDHYPTGFRPNFAQPPTLGPGKGAIPPAKQPPVFSWRPTGVTSVKNQGSWGTCWIFASVGEFEAKVKMKEAPVPEPDYAEMDILEGVAEGTRPPSSSLHGGHTKEVANHLTKYGTLTESANPYSTAGSFPSPPITNYWNPPKGTPLKQAREWHDLGNLDQTGQVSLLKNIILNNGPVTAAVRVDTINNWATSPSGPGVAFNSMSWNSNWVVPYLPTYYSPDHAILIVGWDDNKMWYGGGGSGAWLVKNSWSTSWGAPSADAGYFWIAYGSARIGSQAGYYPVSGYVNYPTNETLLYYDEFGSWGSAGWTGIYDIFMLNVYTPPSNGKITHVDFWATYQNLSYDIRIYDNWSDTSSSPTLQLGSRETGTLLDAGYYSIQLSSPARVNAGDNIYILLRLREPTHTYNGLIPLEVDANDTGYSWLWFPNAKSKQTNKCYVRYNTTSSWASMNALGDVGIRARLAPPDLEVNDWRVF